MSDDLHALLQKVKDLRTRHDLLSAQVNSFTAHTRRLVSALGPAPVPASRPLPEEVPLLEFQEAEIVVSPA